MKISFRWTLILGVLGLIWITQLISTTSTHFSSQKVLLRHSRDIMENIADLTIEQSEKHLSLAQGAAHLTKRLMTSEVVGSSYDHLDVLERYFLDQLAIYPHFAGIYIGKPNGDFFYVSRSITNGPPTYRTKIIRHLSDQRQTSLRWRDKNHAVISEEIDPQDTFDPRMRPWYQKALKEQNIVWTDPYIFFTSEKPGITIAGPVYDSEGQLQGVVGVDIQIDQLSLFISKLRIGKSGRAFMINTNGDVVAFPDLDKLKFYRGPEGGKTRLVKITELDDAITVAAYKAVSWSREKNDRLKLEKPYFARFEFGGKVYDAMFTPFPNSNWPWIIGTYLPENDYLGDIKANRRFNLLITLALSVLTTLVGLRLSRGIIRPLAALEKEAIAIKQKDLTQNYDTTSVFTELQETADAFDRMKEALVRSEEKYRSIFENIQDIYYEASLDGYILEVSPSVNKFSDYTREELIGSPFIDLYEDPGARDAFMAILEKEGKVDDYELRLKNKNGEIFYCAVTAILKCTKNGAPGKTIGSLRIINDRKRAEFELLQHQNRLEELVRERTLDLEKTNEQLRLEVKTRKEKEEELKKNEEKYRSIIENMANGYYEMDLDGNLTFFNDPMIEILGYPKEQILGLNYHDYLSPEKLTNIEKRFAAIRSTGVPEKLSRYTIIRKNGERKTIEASTALITDNNGNVLGYRGVVLDITEKLNAEREKKKLEERFQQIQRLEGIGTLAGGVAHDFNNLLMGIQGNVSLMLLDTPPNHRHYQKLKGIETCVAGGSDLTRQLLGFARGGKYLVKTLDMNQVVHSTVGMFGRTRKEIQIVEKMQDGIWPVRGDQSQIEQVVLNLCINAWQAMPDGGNIYIETKNVELEDTAVKPFGIKPGRYVLISVADVGIGMDEVTQEKIFEPFFTTKEMGRGTGLGLASAYGIIKNHDGAIDFVSQVGQGTTFYIYLPASERHLESRPTGSIKQSKGAGTILLVDDEKIILKVSQSMLEQLGYTVLPALGGRSAIEIFDQTKERIDLVILDMVMPEMSGAAVFEHIIVQHPRVKVLLSSGYSMTDQTEALIDRGCKGFIQKPFDIDQLGAKIHEILNGTVHTG